MSTMKLNSGGTGCVGASVELNDATTSSTVGTCVSPGPASTKRHHVTGHQSSDEDDDEFHLDDIFCRAVNEFDANEVCFEAETRPVPKAELSTAIYHSHGKGSDAGCKESSPCVNAAAVQERKDGESALVWSSLSCARNELTRACAVKPALKTSSLLPTVDEKTRERKARQRALLQQQSTRSRNNANRKPHSADVPFLQSEQRDYHSSALTPTAAGASTANGNSNKNTGSFSNTDSITSTAAAKAQIHAVSLVLEDDSGHDGNDLEGLKAEAGLPVLAESDVKRKARADGGAAAKATRRLTTTSVANGLSDVDILARRGATTQHQSTARRRRATLAGDGATCHAHTAIFHSSINGPSGGTVDDTAENQHSTCSSAGAHSVVGGRLNSKKSFGDNEEDDDAVHHHLTLVAHSQAARTSDFFFRENDVLATCSFVSGAQVPVVANIILEKDEDNTEDAIERANDDGNEEVLEEAQAGVPVIPGAFAVEGLDGAGANGDGLDEAFDSDLPWTEPEVSELFSAENVVVNDPTLTDPNSALFFDEELALQLREGQPSALEAELHEIVVCEGLVLTEDPEGLSRKAKRRLQLCQVSVFCLAVGAVAAVVAVATGRLQTEPFEPWHPQAIPVVKGWKQLGLNLSGPVDDEKCLYGYAVAIDSGASRIAIGVPGRDEGAKKLQVGEVQIMDWNGTQWSQSGPPLVGPGPGSLTGTAVALSRDGKRVAVGSPSFSPGGGHVAVYDEVETKRWEIVGQAVVGNPKEINDKHFGGSLALSADGSILAVGATLGDGSESESGYVKVFRLENSSSTSGGLDWVQLGETIVGENSGDLFGWSLAMSNSGKRIAAGAVGSSGGGLGEFLGEVRVFDYSEETNTWTQTGLAVSGLGPFDSFGSSLALSGNGDIIAAGAIGHSSSQQGADVGHVRVFHNSDGPTGTRWLPLGQPLVGQSAFDAFGHSVALSDNGKVVAVGGPRNDEFGESSGQIQVFEFDEVTFTWSRRGSSIGGSYDGGDLFGWAVALSANGTVVAGGAPFSPFDGRLSDVGTVRIFDVAQTG